MSTTYAAPVTCSACGLELMIDVADSLNANRMPDARRWVVERTLFSATCRCGRRITAVKDLLYVDFEHGLWLQVANEVERPRFAAFEPEVTAAFAQAFDAERGPAAITALAAMVRPLLVFGYEELREKVVAAAAALDDSLIEALKLELLVARPDLLTDGVEVMLLASADEGALHFDLYRVRDGGGLFGELVVRRDAYDSIASRRDSVAETYPSLFTAPYVNIARYRFAAEVLADPPDELTDVTS